MSTVGRLGDEGVTLVELIVYSVVAALFLGLMAALFANGLKAQAQATDRDAATGQAQVVSDLIQTSVRNSDVIQVGKATSAQASGTLLQARVASGVSGWECRTWALTSAGALVYKASTSAIAVGSYTGWTVLAPRATGTLTGSVPFAASGAKLSFALTTMVGDTTVPISGGVTAQAKAQGAITSCW